MDTSYPTLPIEDLKEWENNERKISPANFELLKEKLEKKKQFRPFFVTPDDDDPGKYIVLAGNMRLKAYKELGVPSVWVSVLEFAVKEDGLWHVWRDGVEEFERFVSKADAMKDWSLSDNEEFGSYDFDAMANTMHGYNLDWNKYLVSGYQPKSVSEQLKDYLMHEDELLEAAQKEELGLTHDCPDCGAKHVIANTT